MVPIGRMLGTIGLCLRLCICILLSESCQNKKEQVGERSRRRKISSLEEPEEEILGPYKSVSNEL